MKLVREHINEKFKENSDPIQDMGIGGYSFKTLKPGTILIPKKEIYISLNGTFLSNQAFYSLKIWEESYVGVISVEPYTHNHNILIKYYQLWDKSYIEPFITNLADNEHNYNCMIGTQKQFENRFDIVRNISKLK